MSELETIKKKKTTAKRLFTRTDNALIQSVKENDCIEIVSGEKIDRFRKKICG